MTDKDLINYLPIFIFSAFAIYVIFFHRSNYTIKSYSPAIFRYYRPSKRLMSNAEIILFRVIVKHLGSSYIVPPKVRLADFIYVKSHIQKGPMSKTALFARIGQKHADFLITSTDSSKPVHGLNWTTHPIIRQTLVKQTNLKMT